jgi:hypothetical protein
LVVSIVLMASPMQRQASSSWPSSAWPAAKYDNHDGKDHVASVDRHAAIPEVNLIDNGIFGQALVLSAFNYAKGEGIEFSAKFHSGLEGVNGISEGGSRITEEP